MPKGKPNKRYTPEFKIMVVETMHNENLIPQNSKGFSDSEKGKNPRVTVTERKS